MTEREVHDSVAANVAKWTKQNAAYTDGRAQAAWQRFDLAISEYGASLWADPARWLPEAARLLRPGGRLIFLTNSVLAYLCSPDEGKIVDRLVRDQFGMYRITWPGEEGVEYHLSHGDWIVRLRASGFAVEALRELQAPPDATAHPYYDWVRPEWARRWPAEEIWVARKRAV